MKATYRPVPVREIVAALPEERRARVAARSKELIDGENALRELRQSRAVTQDELARRVGGKQVYISRLEKRSDMKLSTLREYIRALGGELQVLATFPEGEKINLGKIGARKTATKRTAPA